MSTTLVLEHAAGHETSALLAQASQLLLRSVSGGWEVRIEPAVVGGRWFVSFTPAGSEDRHVVRVGSEVRTLRQAVHALFAGCAEWLPAPSTVADCARPGLFDEMAAGTMVA